MLRHCACPHQRQSPDRTTRAKERMLWSGTTVTQDGGVCEVPVVDDDVCQFLRAYLGQVDRLSHMVAVEMQAGRFGGAFHGAVAGDAAAQRCLGIHLEPDAVFPAVVVLGAELSLIHISEPTRL